MFEKDLALFQCVQFRNEFITRMYEGNNLSEACAIMRVNPAACGIYARDNPEFDSDIRKALAFRIDIMTDKLENIQDYEDNPIMAGVISKNIQWLATKRSRALYGEKVDVNHNVVIDIRGAMDMARQRSLTVIHDKPLIELDNDTDNISVKPLISEAIVVSDEVDPLS